MGFENPIEARFTGEIPALVREPWHDLGRREMAIFWLVTDLQDGLLFLFTELMGRGRAHCVATLIPFDGLRTLWLPSPQGGRCHPNDLTRLGPTCTRLNRLCDQLDNLNALGGRNQASSSSHSAWYFFCNTNSAAASANALSLRLS